MITVCRVLLIIGSFVIFNSAQLVADEVFHFTNPTQGNAVWILDESSLPWTGGYQFLRSISVTPTTLISVVDSSTGVTLGQCVAPQGPSVNNSKQQFEQFNWELTSSGLSCKFENGEVKRVEFDLSPNPRTFSIRIQSVTGPACVRNMVVQTEEATGCPPHLSRNSFSANSLNCSCPYLDVDAANEDGENENEDVDMLASASMPQFPLFKGIDSSALEKSNNGNPTQWTLAPSPCANYECHNNGTCLVSGTGAATCLCRNGFIGDHCELDVCVSVPCQNGGVCRSNNGQAYCECPPAFTGLLCESSQHELKLSCEPECSNGQCVIKDGQASCECRQGFTGANCNVLDVCLGDAACSMFGPDAKCVLDDNMDKMISVSLMNGTYDCLCPHPIHGQFVDCMQLHVPTATSMEPSAPVETHATPSFPVLEISQLPTGQPTTFTVPTLQSTATSPTPVANVQTIGSNQSVQSTPPAQPFGGFTVTREPLRITDFGTTLPPPFNQRIITGSEQNWSQQPVETTPTQPKTITTFVFPQTPETTTIPSSPVTQQQPQPTPKFVAPIASVTEEEEEDEEEETTDEAEEVFPTPSTIQVISSESTAFETTSKMFTTTSTSPPTTSEGEDEEDEDLTTEEVTESSTQSSTTSFATEPPSTTTEVEIMTSDEEKEEIISSTTLTSIPFWMTTTLNRIAPTVSNTPMIIVPHPETTTEPPMEEESEEDMKTAETTEENVPKNVEVPTTPSDVSHHHTSSGKQSSAAASWIIAIIALIVLGLLLLATSLFILRYIRQSRKLHGKYNPAREEHNLSAAYAMPMSHIAKEERLI